MKRTIITGDTTICNEISWEEFQELTRMLRSGQIGVAAASAFLIATQLFEVEDIEAIIKENQKASVLSTASPNSQDMRRSGPPNPRPPAPPRPKEEK